MGKDMNRRSLFISNFNKKTIFWIKAVIIFFSIIVFCAVMAEQFEENYCAAVIDKAERLRSIEGPKLVLLGDSNVVLGVDSRQLEEAFGMPVVNMALHAGIGNVFHERMARLNVAKGDVYIYAPCSFDDKDKIEDPVLAWTAIGNHWELFNLIPEHDRWRMVKRYPTFLKKCINRFIEGTGDSEIGEIYSRSNFNEYGDIAYKNPEYRWNFTEPVVPSKVNDRTAERIDELAEWLEERGATLVVAAYPIADGELTSDREEFTKFQEELEQKLKCKVISDFTDYMYDYDYFYDSPLHLTAEGTDLRTSRRV